MLSDSAPTPAMPSSHCPHTHLALDPNLSHPGPGLPGLGSQVKTCFGVVVWFFFSPELPTTHAGSSPDAFFPDISASQIITLAPQQPQP